MMKSSYIAIGHFASLLFASLIMVPAETPTLQVPKDRQGWKQLDGKRFKMGGVLHSVHLDEKKSQCFVVFYIKGTECLCYVSLGEGYKLRKAVDKAAENKENLVWVQMEGTFLGNRRLTDAKLLDCSVMHYKEAIKKEK